MNITVIGTGYVGLVTGTCFAEVGHNVICLDKDIPKINKLKKGIIPIYEPKLDSLVKSNYKDKRLNFTTSYKEAINSSDISEQGMAMPVFGFVTDICARSAATTKRAMSPLRGASCLLIGTLKLPSGPSSVAVFAVVLVTLPTMILFRPTNSATNRFAGAR